MGDSSFLFKHPLGWGQGRVCPDESLKVSQMGKRVSEQLSSQRGIGCPVGLHAWLGARLGSVGSKGLVNRSLTGTHTWRGIRLAPSNTSHTDLCCHVPVSFSQRCTLALPSWRCQRAHALRGNNTHPTVLTPPTSTPLEVWCLGPLGTDSGWALQKPSRQVPQDHALTPQALLTCSRASGSLGELLQLQVSSATS